MWRLGSGESVIDREDSHLNQHADVLAVLSSALLKVNSRDRQEFGQEVCFTFNVGRTICVETCSSDEIIYAQRVGRAGLTRFVKNRTDVPTTKVTVFLKQHETEPRTYVLTTAFIGQYAPKEPWDATIAPDDLDFAKRFWNRHALLWSSQEIVPGTETTTCPWQ